MDHERAGKLLRDFEIKAMVDAHKTQHGNGRAFLTCVQTEFAWVMEIKGRTFKQGPPVFEYLIGNCEFTRVQFRTILCLLKERA
jgi:hypothetical protein